MEFLRIGCLEIYPLDRIVLDGKSIWLGMERSEVESVIGKGEFVGKRCYYYGNELAIDYDEDSRVEIIKEKTEGEISEPERGYSVIFQNSSIGLYKETRSEDVLEMIEEMKAEGISIENNEDIEIENRKSNYWATFGIGIQDYYQ